MIPSDPPWLNDELRLLRDTATSFFVQEAAPLMPKWSQQRFVDREFWLKAGNIASRAWHGNPGQANYSAAKAGVVGLTRSVAKELGRYSVTANAIAPGLVETESLHQLPSYAKIAERAKQANSIKRLGEPSDVAAAAAFLASAEAGLVTGEVVHVSGGRFG